MKKYEFTEADHRFMFENKNCVLVRHQQTGEILGLYKDLIAFNEAYPTESFLLEHDYDTIIATLLV